MLIDLKYHLISLVAVFLALAVGMLVGSSFVAGTSVKGLEQQFIQLREENLQQRRTMEQMQDLALKQQEFGRAVAPKIVNGRLAMRRVAIIQTGDYSEATQNAKAVIEQAGGTVVSITTLADLESTREQERLVRALGQITGEMEYKDPLDRMLGIVANCIASGSNQEFLGVFQEKELLTRSGDYTHRVIRVVLIGGSRRRANLRPQHTDLLLIDKLQEAGVMTIVGVEPAHAVTSYIPMYHRKAIATVDNIDQPMGQVALVYAIAGETANYGIKKSADRVVPAGLETRQ